MADKRRRKKIEEAQRFKIDGDLRQIDPKAHRRFLRFLNDARSPDQLRAPPRIDEGEPDEPPPAVREKIEPLMDADTAKRLFEARDEFSPVYGFAHVRDLLALDWIDPAMFGHIFPIFGPATYGRWDELYDTPVTVAHAALVHTQDDNHAGRVIFIQLAHYTPTWQTPLWKPEATSAAGAFETPTPPTDNLYCCGHSFLSAGSLLCVGGGGQLNEVPNPIMAWEFDPATKSWLYTRDKVAGSPTFGARTEMAVASGRWYPTAVTLGDDSGRVLIVNGLAAQMEIYDHGTGRFGAVTGAGAPDASFWPYSADYPRLHLLPTGEVFYPRSHRAGSAAASSTFSFTGYATGQWTGLAGAAAGPNRDRGMSVLLLGQDPADPDRIMVVGGGDATTSQTIGVMDYPPAMPTWQTEAFPDGTARRNVNVVQLPDGKVFICGGTSSAADSCWLYTPDAPASRWRAMDNLTYARNSTHAMALLLPSGKVMVAGGSTNRIEVFSPPYLFNSDNSLATRPQITSFPDPDGGDVILHGYDFDIGTPQAGDIAKVALVRPMAVTHQTDTEQRVIQLSHRQTGPQTRTATAPDGRVFPYGASRGHSHPIAPRGHYMLFIIDNQGVPSLAKFVKLR